MLTTTDRLHDDPRRERQQMRNVLVINEPSAPSTAGMRDSRRAPALAALVAVNLQFGTLAAGA